MMSVPPDFDTYTGPVFRYALATETADPRNAAARAMDLADLDRDTLSERVRDAIGRNSVRSVKLHPVSGGGSVPTQIGWKHTEFLIWPLGEDAAYLLGWNLDDEEALLTALTQSRTLYKDLADLAADFVWETDGVGRFSFISRQGAFGYRAEDLVGRSVDEFLMRPHAAPSQLPFQVKRPVRNVDLWLRGPDGRAHCVSVSGLPVIGDDGDYAGSRGLGLDVTVERTQQADLAQATNREDLVRYVINLARSEETHTAMLGTAAKTLARGSSSDVCQIWVAEGGDWHVAAQFGETPDDLDALAVARSLPVDGSVSETPDGTLGAVTLYRGEPNGAIVLWRPGMKNGWPDDVKALLEAVEAPMGLTLRQVADQQALHEMARTDELTKLLNRRAFMAELDRAIARAHRMHEAGALLYVDLDNFKPINDTFGHEAGDDILKRVAEALTDNSREYDLIARLGGDEFALWLDATDDGASRDRATRLIQAFEPLKQYSAAPDKPFGVSIGIALYTNEKNTTLPELLAEADTAMYVAKKGGKNNFAFADQGNA